jgi:uncharacterized SAM-binding protein YcdF (DUF218 family)
MSLESLNVKDYLGLQRLLTKETLSVGQADLGYVVGETIDNQPQTLAQSATLLDQGIIKKIGIYDPLPPYQYGYLGPEYCRQVLHKAGVKKDQILIISLNKHFPKQNTQTEFRLVAEYLGKIGYNGNIVIIAPWFHILRSYITALSEFGEIGLGNKVFSLAVPLKPYEVVRHSQGIQQGTRRTIFYEEVYKCATYKNLISIKEAREIYNKHHPKTRG